MIAGGFADTTVPAAPAPFTAGDIGFPAQPAGTEFYDSKLSNILQHQESMQTSQQTHQLALQTNQQDFQWDMFLGQTIGQGVGDLIKMVGWIWGMGIQANAAETINDRRMEAQENVAGFQKDLGFEYLKIQNQANERLYGPNGYAREVENIKANKELAALDKNLEYKKEVAAMRTLDDAFSIQRNDYFYG